MNAPQAKTTVADYLAFERASTERHQFVDGVGIEWCTKTGAFFPRSDEPLGLHLCRRIGRLPDPAQFRR